MRNIMLTDSDIKNALKNEEFVQKYNIKYKEAIFIRYLNEQKEITLEQFDILTSKYTFPKSTSINNITINYETFKGNENNYTLFSNYFKNLKFDEYAMFEIILAAKALYLDKSNYLLYDTSMIIKLYTKYFKQNKNLKKLRVYYLKTLANHEIAGLIRQDLVTGDDYTNISKERAKNELIEYSKIYGIDQVNTIKKYVKENK